MTLSTRINRHRVTFKHEPTVSGSRMWSIEFAPDNVVLAHVDLGHLLGACFERAHGHPQGTQPGWSPPKRS